MAKHVVDERVRRAAFEWLVRQSRVNNGVFTHAELKAGFNFEGEQVHLISRQGIFKPRQLSLPLTIMTSVKGPYADSVGPDGLLRYRYRGHDPNHPENVGLRELMRFHVPLIYFHGLLTGRYLAIWPVLIVGDDVTTLTFSVAVDDYKIAALDVAGDSLTIADEAGADARRRYVTALVHRRVHQEAFRERVLAAYRDQCAFCQLRHRELLDAAHIIGDKEEGGEPIVNNGLALCKLHHKAYDSLFLSVRPDYVIEVRKDVLVEVDGPVLKHALQGLHGSRMHLPRAASHWPDRERLETRYRQFVTSDR